MRRQPAPLNPSERRFRCLEQDGPTSLPPASVDRDGNGEGRARRPGWGLRGRRPLDGDGGVGPAVGPVAFDPGAAAVALGDGLHEGEGGPAAPHAPAVAAPFGRASCRRASNEALEDAFALVGRDAGPTVDDANDYGSVLARRADGDDAGTGGVLDRVVDEVDDRELDRALVDARARKVALDLGDDADPFGLGAVPVDADGLRDRVAHAPFSE